MFGTWTPPEGFCDICDPRGRCRRHGSGKCVKSFYVRMYGSGEDWITGTIRIAAVVISAISLAVALMALYATR